MKIDGSSFVQMNNVGSNQQTQSAQKSTASRAMAELNAIKAGALEETREGLSLAISNSAKKIQVGKDAMTDMVNGLQQLLEKMDSMGKETINKMTENMSQFKSADEIFNALNQSGISKGDMALVLTSLLAYKGLSDSIKRALKKTLESLLGEADIDLEILAATSGANLDKESLRTLGQLYQHAKAGEKGLAHWFNLLRDHKDKKKYLKLMIKALSEPLSDGQRKDDMTQIAATILDLRRILIFMAFEDHCRMISSQFDMKEEALQIVTLNILDSSWIMLDELVFNIKNLGINDRQKITFVRRWKEMFSIMSTECFKNEEHKSQIDDVFIQLTTRWNEEDNS